VIVFQNAPKGYSSRRETDLCARELPTAPGGVVILSSSV
jgi:hypothetical protein